MFIHKYALNKKLTRIWTSTYQVNNILKRILHEHNAYWNFRLFVCKCIFLLCWATKFSWDSETGMNVQFPLTWQFLYLAGHIQKILHFSLPTHHLCTFYYFFHYLVYLIIFHYFLLLSLPGRRTVLKWFKYHIWVRYFDNVLNTKYTLNYAFFTIVPISSIYYQLSMPLQI